MIVKFSPNLQKPSFEALKQAPGTAPSMLVVCRTIPLGDVVYTFEFSVKKFLPIGKVFGQ